MDALRKELERQERSRAWLARKVGCDPSLVHRILTGERQPSTEFKEKSAAALGVPAEELYPDTVAA